LKNGFILLLFSSFWCDGRVVSSAAIFTGAGFGKFVMLGMGLSLVSHTIFKRHHAASQGRCRGYVCQIVVLPLLGALIANDPSHAPDLAVGPDLWWRCVGRSFIESDHYLAKGRVGPCRLTLYGHQ